MKKILITTAILASLTITSISAATAVSTDNTVKTTSTATTSVDKKGAGSIEYAKKTLFNPDGSIAAVDETWADLVTHNERSSYQEPDKETGALCSIGGAYVLDNGTTYIKTFIDEQGKLSGITIKTKNPNNWNKMLVTEKQEYINEYREGTRRAGWNDKGIISTTDGKDLRMLSRADKSAMPGEEGVIYKENVYLDNNSGLPVKGEISEEKDGKTTLLYTYTFEFKNVKDDGSLFDTWKLNLKEMK